MILILKNKGFSLVEILIATAISIVIIMYLIDFLKVNDNANKKIMTEMENTSDNLNMESILRNDITGAKHSLNNLSTKDDKGYKFFDYLSSSTCLSNCSRSIKLVINDKKIIKGKEKKSIYFIISDTFAGEQQVFNPSDAYVRNTMNLKSLNYENNLGIREKSPWNVDIKSNSVLMMIYSPIEVFKPGSNDQIPGKNLGFMGWAGANNYMGALIPEAINDGALKYYDGTDPRTGQLIKNEDEFFQAMPFTIGLSSFAFLTSVKIIRYRLELVKINREKVGLLFRGEMNPDKTFNEIVVGYKIGKVEFYRDTISSPAIYIKTESME